jgi:hypothetical protein
MHGGKIVDAVIKAVIEHRIDYVFKSRSGTTRLR